MNLPTQRTLESGTKASGACAPILQGSKTHDASRPSTKKAARQARGVIGTTKALEKELTQISGNPNEEEDEIATFPQIYSNEELAARLVQHLDTEKDKVKL